MSVLGSRTSGFGYEGETGGERNLVIIEDKPIKNHINENVSSRALYSHGYSF